MEIPDLVQIKEVGPRDGLQNEMNIAPTEQKIEWIDLLSETGLSYIEITSFVAPKWIPQLADALEVSRKIKRKDTVTYAALVPNRKGLENALLANIDEVSIFMSASEAHNQKNINKSIADTFPILQEVAEDASKEGKTTRAYVSTVFGCPYEGEVQIDAVLHICDKLFAMGVDEISLGDTIGIAHPKQVDFLLDEVTKRFNKDRIALHFHDTRGMALANILVALKKGYTIFDSSLGGLGGCPYATGASGNVATDDLVYMLERMGIRTGIDGRMLAEAADYIQKQMGIPLSSKQMAIQEKKEGRRVN
ncbi:hydroxymethylglutaryl-CoA lyase [Pradoshia sp. D12]|uniref:hydroxymethylglutaryl-CoA lyase n=1 Tax=Bacillaceae TaxID=186817 RepID=UPI00112BABB8|nr:MULTISPECIES: hydroxymethylglutaryl-CoA lyase [Bacillaceae]QFK71311.1 hydroxymethylglutaryl-CoA lyase [Pradoshia sp. D12]TPF73106.1 hydroxymethylglutaryl-CoA lyase [Bacillus sp. D12]